MACHKAWLFAVDGYYIFISAPYRTFFSFNCNTSARWSVANFVFITSVIRASRDKCVTLGHTICFKNRTACCRLPCGMSKTENLSPALNPCRSFIVLFNLACESIWRKTPSVAAKMVILSVAIKEPKSQFFKPSAGSRTVALRIQGYISPVPIFNLACESIWRKTPSVAAKMVILSVAIKEPKSQFFIPSAGSRTVALRIQGYISPVPIVYDQFRAPAGNEISFFVTLTSLNASFGGPRLTCLHDLYRLACQMFLMYK